MNINIKLWYKRFRYSIDVEYLILLALAGLHHNKKITDEKLKGQFKALREGTLQKMKNTYHCDINDRWYSDDPPLVIFDDCILDLNINTIPYKEFINYIKQYKNCNYNYALNVFGSEYLYKIFLNWNPEYNNDFSNYAEFFIPHLQYKDTTSYCYECGSRHGSYDKDVYNNLKVINDWIHNQKKGNLTKIPKFDVSNRYFWC